MGLAHTHHRAPLRRGPRRGHARRDPGQPAGPGGLPQDVMPPAPSTDVHTYYGKSPHPARRVARGRARARSWACSGATAWARARRSRPSWAWCARPRATVTFEGRPIARHGRRTGWPRLGIAWVPEDRRIFRLLTVMENLRTGLDRRRRHARRGERELLDKVYALLPRARRAARPGGRHAVGRRAADAGHRPRHDARAQDHPARRAHGGARCRAWSARSARSSTCSTGRAWPSCSWSRTCR